MKVLVVFGTRPEAIKMAPLVRLLGETPGISSALCVTGQHKQMLNQVLDLFQLTPDYDLSIMKDNQGLTDITASILTGMKGVIENYKPDFIMVHGDTATTFAASLAAYYDRIPVGHVEAGLRTGNIYSPWPEEVNRKLTGAIAAQHYAPTQSAKVNLLREGVDEKDILVTGNTVIDALLFMLNQLQENINLQKQLDDRFSFINFEKKVILVTGHRRENFGEGFDNICMALKSISEQENVEIVYPVHLNPNVQAPVYKMLGGLNNVHLIQPLDYQPFLYLMSKSYLIITDSGGIQEEAPSLGKPVLVMRDTTERPEAVEAGTVKLVGTNTQNIIDAALEIISDHSIYETISSIQNPYGDGKACERIVDSIKRLNLNK